jgi:hypothetical protein
VQVVRVGALDPDGGDLADAQRPPARDIDGTVDLRRVRHGASLGHARTGLVDDNLLARADLALQSPRRDFLLRLHETVPALFLDFVRHGRGTIVRRRAIHRLVFEAADAIERGCVQPLQEQFEVLLGLAGKADDEGRA